VRRQRDRDLSETKHHKTGIYHIMVRGINRHGYCIMGNHVHLLLREGQEPLSLTMQRICSSFVFWYNLKYDRVRHLFQERYKSEVVENEGYLITVLRYIHQNPVKAGIASSAEQYRWSSYHEYIGKQNIIDAEAIFELFATEKERAKKEFEKYMSQKNEDVCLDYEERHRLSDEEVKKMIEKQYGIKSGFFHNMERQEMNIILKNLKATKGVTIRQLARITGASKYMVEKA